MKEKNEEISSFLRKLSFDFFSYMFICGFIKYVNIKSTLLKALSFLGV